MIPLTLAQSIVASDPGAFDRVLDRMLASNMFGWVVFCSFVIVLTLISKTASTIKSVSRERTRREIAAFIAEGSISPEQGERLMKAGRNAEEC